MSEQPKSFYARYGLVIMAVSLFLLPFAVIGSIRAKQANKNEVRNWIPQEYEETKVYKKFREELFGGEEFILLSWDTCNSTDTQLEDLALKLVPPCTIQIRDGETTIERTAPDLETAKIELERLFEEKAATAAAATGKPLEEVKLYYSSKWKTIANNRQEMLVYSDPKVEGSKNETDKSFILASISRTTPGFFNRVNTGPRVINQITKRNKNFDPETAALQMAGVFYAPDQVLREGMQLHRGNEVIPVAGTEITIDEQGFVQVDGQDLLHKGHPVGTLGQKVYVAAKPIHKYDPDGNALHPDTGAIVPEAQLATIGLPLRQTCVVVSLTDAAVNNKKAALDELKRIAIQECQLSASELHIGGPTVDNVAIDEAGNKSLNILAGCAILIGFVVSWVSLRSLKLVLIVLSAGIYSSVISLSIVWYMGYPVDAILFTMPSLVYVATTSGAIHLSNYYRDVRREGHPATGAAGAALSHAALPLALATGTTAVGLATLCYTELVPIYNFGLFSSIGVIVSALLLVFYIPAALELWQPAIEMSPQPEPVTETHTHIDDHGFWWRMGQLVLVRNKLATVCCLAVMALIGYGIFHNQTAVQLMRLLSPREQIRQDYAYLEEKLGPLVPMEIVVWVPKPTSEEHASLRFIDRLRLIDTLQRSIQTIPEVGSSMSALTLLENIDDLVDKTDKRLVGGRSVAEGTVNRQLLRHRAELLTTDFLREHIGPGAKPEMMEAWRISARVSAIKNVDYAKFINNLKAHVEPVLADYLQEVKLAGPVQSSVSGLLPAWVDRSEFREGIHVEYTGVVPLVYKAQHSLVDGLVFGFLTDFALIVIVMMIACRDWSAGLVLLLPSAFPAVCVFGGMGWIHQFLQTRGWGDLFIDIGYVMAPSVALGVTVDDVVHFMLWFKKGITEGMTRKQAVELAYRGCARAMYQSWGVIGIGLAVFSLSPFMPTRNFGLMMISMLTVALVGNLILMPAILAGWGGQLFAWGIRNKENRVRAKQGLPLLLAEGGFSDAVAIDSKPQLAVIQAEVEEIEDVPVAAESPQVETQPESEEETVSVRLPIKVQDETIPEPHVRQQQHPQDQLRRNFRRK